MTNPNLGLVLTSGGARGAYQAGALLAVSELCKGKELPFQVLSGVSAGTINCAFLASRAQDFKSAARALHDLWAEIKPKDVFHTDTGTLTKIGVNWLTDLSLGGWFGSGRGKSLLDTSPLKDLLQSHVDPNAIVEHIKSGRLHGFALTATNYHTGTAVTFFDGDPSIQPWLRSTRMSKRTPLTIDHLLASAAIPVFFPAVRLDGHYYGDGCIRMNTPLSPAIHLGADRILAIGVRHARTPQAVEASNAYSLKNPRYPYLADIAGILLNAMFLDGLESDVERMERINQTLGMIPSKERAEHPQKLRQIPVMTLKPSQDLGSLVLQELQRFPRALKHLLRGLGASDQSGWDLLSYLAFESTYTKQLLELGYSDTMAVKSDVIRFME